LFNGFSDRAIPLANVDLHNAHCSRNLQKCKVCGDMVPKKNAEDHYLTTHAPVCVMLYRFDFTEISDGCMKFMLLYMEQNSK
jgi:hypothetical protein